MGWLRKKVTRRYIFFNNDGPGYAVNNALKLSGFLKSDKNEDGFEVAA